MNILETYRQQEEAAGRNLAQLLDGLNKHLGTNYQHGRWAQWESGARQPSLAVYEYLVGRVLPVLLHDAGVSRRKIQRITASCRLPARESK